jgi:serine/threonine-protein kinase
VRIGKYELIEKLGRGGMAEVWKARINGPEGFVRLVAIKRILPHLLEDPRFVARFLVEARLSAGLHHANIVQTYELNLEEGRPFLVLEYLSGCDLLTLLRGPAGRLPLGLAAFVTYELCRALAYLHDHQDEKGHPLRLIHRDVSPSNVMLTFEGGVKLLDFGIAKALAAVDRDPTRTGVVPGKLRYVAPEQLSGAQLDRRVDLFAAGAVLYDALSGQVEASVLGEGDRCRRPSRLNPEVPPDLDRICDRALQPDRDRRYSTAQEMAADLEEVLRRLKWGARNLSLLMAERFPEPVRRAEGPIDATAATATATLEPVNQAYRPFRWHRAIWLIGGVATVLWASRFAARRQVQTPLGGAPRMSQPLAAPDLGREIVLAPGVDHRELRDPPSATPSAHASSGRLRHRATSPSIPEKRHDVHGGAVVNPFAP